MDLITGILEKLQMVCKLLSYNWFCGMINEAWILPKAPPGSEG